MNEKVQKTETAALPSIPAKRYFTIGEVSELCGVKPHVLRYWEHEFTQLKPVKRRGNRRYYQHHEVLLIRRIRELLYEQGYTITGARNKLNERGISVAEPEVSKQEQLDAFSADIKQIKADLNDVLTGLRTDLKDVQALLTVSNQG
ncbi:MAG: MerR family transcriptional regulator [Oxalobacter sp.]|nr:MerR family transcriptional regulator [Oxalobacter sp.]